MFLNILAKEGRIWEIKPIAYLFDAEIGLFQIETDFLQYLFFDPLVSRLAGILLDDGREVLRRNAKLVSV